MRGAFLALALAACAPSSPIQLRDAYGFQPVLGDVGAVYFTVENVGRQADTLTAVQVAGAAVAMIHGPGAGGSAEMQHLDALEVPARSSVELRPGGLHVMVEGFTTPPVAGDTLAVTATFARAGAVIVRAPIRAYGDAP